ncbi:conserved hypothetical protein ['Nostoc azollae' 0708]|jgi:hypothetical protein|uniref:Uncharacterized protein n=1 Tax=Nostoc azollae (strain 0708) TaxID=551115 RepID=D7E1W0_NOSA0|nr:conserved hypothetical protein ['Nostoc azollae' 0708]
MIKLQTQPYNQQFKRNVYQQELAGIEQTLMNSGECWRRIEDKVF